MASLPSATPFSSSHHPLLFPPTPSPSSLPPSLRLSPSEVLTPCWALPQPLAAAVTFTGALEEEGALLSVLTGSEGVCAGKVDVIHRTAMFFFFFFF